ncbi:MAG: alpha/beta fold hydrolase [Ilumatobacteraceae bacterium]
MTAASVNGITIEYDVHGDEGGDALLLVMGLGGQLVAWPLEFVDLMVARGFRVIRFDNRDIGLSTMIPAPPPTRRQLVLATVARRFAKSSYVINDMAADAAALLDHLGIEKAHVVGISMGGMISQALAIHHPDKVASLTSIMSNTGDRKHGKIKRSLLRKLPKLMVRTPDNAVDNGVEMFRLISGPHFDAAESRRLGQEAYARSFSPEGVARQTMAIAASPDRTWDLRRVRVPTLVVHGLVDPLVTPSGGVATAQAIPGAKLVMYPDMGHDLPRPRWADLIEEITDNARRAGPDGSAGERAAVA